MKKYHFAKITSKGQLTLPLNVRNLLGLDKGDNLEIYLEDNQIVMKKVSPVSPNLYQQHRGVPPVTTDHEGYCESKGISGWWQSL